MAATASGAMPAQPPILGEFRTPFDYSMAHPITLVELRMRTFSGILLEKPRWWEKILDEDVKASWRREIVRHDKAMFERDWGGPDQPTLWFDEGRTAKRWPRQLITDEQINYIFDELTHFARPYDPASGIQRTMVPSVYQSYQLIPQELKHSFVNAATYLEDVPADELDWHPGSGGQVLDLLHPSLYCYRVGKTPSKNDAGTDYATLSREEYANLYRDRAPRAHYRRPPGLDMLSRQHQWIPSEFSVSEDGKVRPVSYIHNLHPTRDRALYGPITGILERLIPLFERVLTDALDDPVQRCVIETNPDHWYDHVVHLEPRWGSFPDSEMDGHLAEYARVHKWPLIPDPPPFEPPAPRPQVSLRGRHVQVIVKLANIVLTPEKPAYAGGSWHVEGMENERIVATGIYYYCSQNITSSRLAFRSSIGHETAALEWNYEQDDQKGFQVAFGMQNEMNQVLGAVGTPQDACLAFPNIYQHRVQPFELVDKTLPGVRKILCFFLVDPTKPILSTATVPPLNREWYDEVLKGIPRLFELPQEIHDMIMPNALEGTMLREEAEAEREKLMQERRQGNVDLDRAVFELEFNMCEH